METDPPTPCQHNKGGFEKKVQNAPKAFNVDRFSPPAIVASKEDRVASSSYSWDFRLFSTFEDVLLDLQI